MTFTFCKAGIPGGKVLIWLHLMLRLSSFPRAVMDEGRRSRRLEHRRTLWRFGMETKISSSRVVIWLKERSKRVNFPKLCEGVDRWMIWLFDSTMAMHSTQAFQRSLCISRCSSRRWLDEASKMTILGACMTLSPTWSLNCCSTLLISPSVKLRR